MLLSFYGFILLLYGVDRVRVRGFAYDSDILEIPFSVLHDHAADFDYDIKVDKISLDGSLPLVTLVDPDDFDRDVVSCVQSVIKEGVTV